MNRVGLSISRQNRRPADRRRPPGRPKGGAATLLERAQPANDRHPLPREGGRGEGCPRRPRGLTSLEFAIVLAIIATLAYFLLRGLLFMQGEGERQAFEDNRAALERAVSYELMSRNARGEGQGAAALAGQDPFQWLHPEPLGWAGAYPAGGPLRPGAWYWDARRSEVVYVPQDPARVRFTGKAQREIRLRLELTGSGQARLVAVRPFAWQTR